MSNPRKQNLSIEDIYVFPELEELSGTTTFTINSSDVRDYLINNGNILILGPSPSGKSALLKVMFNEYRNQGYTPILVDGIDINSSNLEKLDQIISIRYKAIFGEEYLEEFMQMSPSKKVLLVDDFDEIPLNAKARLKLFDYIGSHFSHSLMTSGNLMSIQQLLETGHNEFLVGCKRVQIPEFGMAMKSKIIEKWVLIGQEETISESDLEHTVKDILDRTTTILRPKIAPSYPLYILTIAESAEQAGASVPSPFTRDSGSFGFFYEWLITSSMHNSPKKIADLNAKYKYLSELAFELFQKHEKVIGEHDLELFNESYLKKMSLKYIDLPYAELINDLTVANILSASGSSYSFKYPCVYYYFIARSLNARLQKPDSEKDVKEIISNLTKNILDEDSESILLFLCYLSEDPFVREAIVQSAKQIFSDCQPTDLDNDLKFIDSLKFDIEFNLPDKKPREIRDEMYRREDSKQITPPDNDEKSEPKSAEAEDGVINSVKAAGKIVRLMGQVLKNFATSWEGADKHSLALESYLLGLRVIKHMLNYVSDNYTALIQECKEDIKFKFDLEMSKIPPDRRPNITDKELENLAKATVFGTIYSICHSLIYATSRYVGNEKLYPTYDEIMTELGQPISVRLIDIGIRLDCQAHLPLDIMENLLKDLEHNNIARSILKQLAFVRLCLWETERDELQKCCQMLDIRQDNPRFYLPGRKTGLK